MSFSTSHRKKTHSNIWMKKKVDNQRKREKIGKWCRREKNVEREKKCNTYFAMIEPYTYRSVSRKNVGMDTFTSNLVWTVRKNEENEQRENKYSGRGR